MCFKYIPFYDIHSLLYQRDLEDGGEIINRIFEASRCELTIHVNLSEGRCVQLFTLVQFWPCWPCAGTVYYVEACGRRAECLVEPGMEERKGWDSVSL